MFFSKILIILDFCLSLFPLRKNTIINEHPLEKHKKRRKRGQILFRWGQKLFARFARQFYPSLHSQFLLPFQETNRVPKILPPPPFTEIIKPSTHSWRKIKIKKKHCSYFYIHAVLLGPVQAQKAIRQVRNGVPAPPCSQHR